MNRRGQILFFVPALALFLVFVLLPSTQTWIDSLHRFDGNSRDYVGFQHYRHVATDAKFRVSLQNNLGYLGWTLLFEVCVGLGLALGLERDTRFYRGLRVAFFAPTVLSMVVVGLVFGFLFKDGVGILPGMFQEDRAILTISVISGWAACGYFMILFLAGLSAIPNEVLEAARLDGATGWKLFWHIKLPLMREILYVALLVCFTGAFKAFDLFWVLIPNQDHSSIVATQMVREVLQFDNRGYGSALAVTLTLLVCLAMASALFLRWLLKRLMTSRVHSSEL